MPAKSISHTTLYLPASRYTSWLMIFLVLIFVSIKMLIQSQWGLATYEIVMFLVQVIQNLISSSDSTVPTYPETSKIHQLRTLTKSYLHNVVE